MSKIKLKNENTCENCGRCMIVCPKGAISFRLGYWNYYPVIDTKKCIGCHACEKVCASSINFSNTMPDFFVGISKKYSQDLCSASGGIFPEVAEYVISAGGAVYGAAFDNKTYTVKHIRITSLSEIQQLRKSKYVQSDWTHEYSKFYEDINTGRLVLFTGTPCQISSLYDYFGKYNNLICVDLFCHGVSSAMLFRKYLLSMKKDIESVDFRSYDNYNYNYNYNFNFNFKDSSPSYVCACENDPFYRKFISSESLKLSCFNCRYATKKHKSDITIGDFDDKAYAKYKGIHFHHPSIIALNTLKGKKLLTLINDNFIFSKIDDKKLVELYYQEHNKIGSWGYNLASRNSFFFRFRLFGIYALLYDSLYLCLLKHFTVLCRKILKGR